MSTKRTSKKIKQVANKANKSPRATGSAAQGATALAELAGIVSGMDIAVTADGFEFGVGMQPQEAKAKAIERSKKVDLKNEVKVMVNNFRTRMDDQLRELSNKVEAQLRPMVEAVSTIAVAQKELTHELASFQDNLNYALGLNDELEPMDIGYGADEYLGEQQTKIEKDAVDEMLVEGIEDAAWTPDIPTTEAYVGPRAVRDDKPIN